MNTRRRWLTAGLAWPALACTGALHAQGRPPVVIGWLTPFQPGFGHKPFSEGMAALGWQIGTHYVLEDRAAAGQADRLSALAQEIAATKPAVIVVTTSAAAKAAAAAAPATPVVLAIGDPLATGLVTNLARPGGLITGLSNVTGDLNNKVIELLKESLPRLRRVGFLADVTASNHDLAVKDARRAAEPLRVESVVVDLARPEDIEPAFTRLARDKVQAVMTLASVWVAAHHPRIIGLAGAQRWPVVGTTPSLARQGGLFGYGPDRTAMIRRSAYYVDRILKGAKPGDLPIEQPTAFELVLNLKTARQLGIEMPPSMLVRATEVIE